MLLGEMEYPELLYLLESPEALSDKIREVMNALEEKGEKADKVLLSSSHRRRPSQRTTFCTYTYT
jgi:hypothetical protein